MTAFESFDPGWLARVDERALELARYEFVINCDDRREAVIDEMTHRAVPLIGGETARLGRAQGLSKRQILQASEEAATNLAMRLRRPEPLATVTSLAHQLAAAAIKARLPEPEQPSQLVSREPELREIAEDETKEKASPRPPQLRVIAARVRDAARRGQITPNDPQSS
jgi:hypothetical protein